MVEDVESSILWCRVFFFELRIVGNHISNFLSRGVDELYLVRDLVHIAFSVLSVVRTLM